MNIAQIGAEWIPAFAGMTPSLNVGVNGLEIGCVAWMEHGITTDAATSGISAWPEATQSAATRGMTASAATRGMTAGAARGWPGATRSVAPDVAFGQGLALAILPNVTCIERDSLFVG